MLRQIADFFTRLFDDSDWPPRWHCGRWTEFHGWLYIVSDLLIWAAYFSIPLVIIRYISKKQGLAFVKLYFLFAAFILACGSTHFLDAIAFWFPMYRLNALVRFITGILSWITVFSLVKLLPQAFSLKSQKELETEIVQRKIAEEQARDNEEQIKTIFDAAPDAIIVIDEQGTIIKWNPRAETLFGWTDGEVTGKRLSEVVIPPRYRDAHQKGLARFLHTGESTVLGKTIEIQALDKKGAEMEVALSISPASRQGRRHFIGFIRDISEQKKAREEIALRTAQLETANKEMEAFAYSVSHDLRAPLRGITGFAGILEEDYGSRLDDEARRIMSVINKNALKMAQLIDDLLVFSRTSRQDVVKKTIPMRSMVGDVIDELITGMETVAIEWVVQDLPDIKGDIAAIRQVWVNLVSNALKYAAGRSPVRIEIGSYFSNGQVVFFVKDNGVGFDSRYKDKLFRVFQRLHGADQFEGTGIGLALVEKIISKHGGTVWADGEPDKGACFFFSLPAE